MKKHFLTVVYAIDDKPETVEAILAQRPWQAVAHTDALKDLEHAQADLTATIDGYDAAWMEVASLKKTLETYKQSGMDFAARVQALERTADKLREENAALQQRDDDWHKEHSNALVEMAKRTHAMDAKNLGLLHALTAEQDENHALHQQLAAIGAGGVEPLRKREYPVDTGNPEADRIIGRLASSDPDFDDCADAVALIHKLMVEHRGPDGFATWKDAAIAYRAARAATKAAAPVVLPEPVAAQSRFIDTPSDTWDSCSVEHARSFGGTGYEVRYLYTEQQVRAMLATATGLPAQAARTWRGGNMTVADLVNNLLMMDQSLPIYGAQYIEHPAGRRRAIAVPPTVSIERVKDSRWIGEGEALNTAIIWTLAEQPAAPQQVQAAAQNALEEAASVLNSINKEASHEVQVGDEVCYWQRKEWIDWAEKEVLPKVRAAIAAAKGE